MKYNISWPRRTFLLTAEKTPNKSVFGVHWLYTHLQKQNKNMRKHMLLPQTVSDQTVLGHQPISCPACYSLVFWAMHRTSGEQLACFAALQQQQMSQSYMGFSTGPMDQQPSEQSLLPSILQMLQRVTWQSTLTTSLEIKANKNYHKHMFSQRDQTLTSALCAHPSVYGKQGLCWRELCL